MKPLKKEYMSNAQSNLIWSEREHSGKRAINHQSTHYDIFSQAPQKQHNAKPAMGQPSQVFAKVNPPLPVRPPAGGLPWLPRLGSACRTWVTRSTATSIHCRALRGRCAMAATMRTWWPLYCTTSATPSRPSITHS